MSTLTSVPFPETDAPPLILILDDEPSILSALRSLLHRHAFRLQVFSE